MEAKSNNLDSKISLQQKNLKLVKSRPLISTSHQSASETLKLIHELEVHQIELEVQNEELMKTRLEALESARKYSDLYDLSPNGYFTIAKNGEIVELNLSGAQILGKERLNLLGSRFGLFLTANSKLIFKHFLSAVFTGNDKVSCEVNLMHGNVDTYLHLTGINNESSKLCWVNAVDITDLRQAENELSAKNEELKNINIEKDKLFSIIAHDLRSPFGAFLGLTEILEKKLLVLKQDKLQKIATSIRESALIVYHLIENLLEWSKMQRGLIECKPENVDIRAVVETSIESLSHIARHKKQLIEIHIPQKIYARVDIRMLESTLRNLLSNALKFSYPNSTIIVAAKANAKQLAEIEIIDYGIGMNKELLENLFVANQNTGRFGTDGESSSGLGLHICKDFIERNGGKLTVKSTKEKGSTFSFTLPLATLQNSSNNS